MSRCGVGSAIISAASQSTVLITPGFLSAVLGPPAVSVYGYSSLGGSISAASLQGKTISSVQSGANSGSLPRLFVSITHGGTPLAQGFFRSITLVGASGTVNFSTSSLGSDGAFTADSNGDTTWSWKGTGIASAPWSVSDNAAQRIVAFFR